MTKTKSNSNLVAIVTMCFIFAMISFVTNMAAPFGNIWKGQYNWAAMMGNMMNFAAYLFMGIPAGKMLMKVGYKKTTLIALATGFVGICVQYLSSYTFLADKAIYVYLLGAFICGFSVCMLNTVVNPMLNLLGGGGNKGNQYRNCRYPHSHLIKAPAVFHDLISCRVIAALEFLHILRMFFCKAVGFSAGRA